MKKFITIILASLMLLASCGTPDVVTNAPDVTDAPEITAEPQVTDAPETNPPETTPPETTPPETEPPLIKDDFSIEAKVTLSTFAGNFDVRELQRVFDNLASNIRKYADRQSPVAISLSLAEGKLTLSQENRIRADIEKSESYGIGLKSIRRIAGLYGGSACVEEEHGSFRITVVFTDFS